MRHQWVMVLVLAGFAGVASGCDHQEKPVVLQEQIDSNNSALVTNAASRLIMDRPLPHSGDEKRLICSEPSPDIAVALSTALALTGSGKTPSGETVSVGYNETTAEAITSLAGRTEAVVALRDGLFKACEAYANGLIHREAYQLILSQYGDLLVTLMLGEAAASAAQKSGSTAAAAAPSPAQQGSLTADLGGLKTALSALNSADAKKAGDPTKAAAVSQAQAALVAAAKKVTADAATPPAGGQAPPPATSTAATGAAIPALYSTYYQNAPIRILQSLVVSCLEKDSEMARQVPVATNASSLAAVCDALYATLASNMATYVTAALAPAGNASPARGGTGANTPIARK
jgi:hypothetical protein